MRASLLAVLLLRTDVRPLAQAWRAVDRAYVDKTFNGHPWFKVCSSVQAVMLKEEISWLLLGISSAWV